MQTQLLKILSSVCWFERFNASFNQSGLSQSIQSYLIFLFYCFLTDMDESCLLRLERETLKFMEIENIFYRLRHAEQISPIYTLFRSIFKKEHEFTIQELINMAKNRNQNPNEFNLVEQYKLNSHIFKQNLQVILNIIIDDVWVDFNKQVSSIQVVDSKGELFQIEEESQFENCKTELEPASESGNDLTQNIEKAFHTPSSYDGDGNSEREIETQPQQGHLEIFKATPYIEIQRKPLGLTHQSISNFSRPLSSREQTEQQRPTPKNQQTFTPRVQSSASIASLGAIQYLQKLNINNFSKELKRKKKTNDHHSLHVTVRKDRTQVLNSIHNRIIRRRVTKGQRQLIVTTLHRIKSRRMLIQRVQVNNFEESSSLKNDDDCNTRRCDEEMIRIMRFQSYIIYVP